MSNARLEVGDVLKLRNSNMLVRIVLIVNDSYTVLAKRGGVLIYSDTFTRSELVRNFTYVGHAKRPVVSIFEAK